MIDCCIVGGEQGVRLAQFIRDNAGGSLEVSDDMIFESFSTDADKIKREYISCSKLIYLINESPDIMADLKVIYDLISTPAFFKVKEFWIFGDQTEINQKGVGVFEKMCLDLKYEDYILRLSDTPWSYQGIYREITGLVDAESDSIPYYKVYRSQRDTEGKVGYDPHTYTKNIVLKQEDRLKKYEEMKQSAIKADTKQLIVDKYQEDIPKVDLNLSKIDVGSSIFNPNYLVVSGMHRAGTSAFASTLAMCLANSKRVNMLDISDNCGSARRCLRKFKKCAVVDNKKLLLGEDYSNNALSIYTSAGIGNSVKLSYLKYYLSIPNRSKSDYVIIDCDLNQLPNVLKYCKTRILKVFLVSQCIEDDVKLTKPSVDKIKSLNLPTMVYLNDSIKWDSSFRSVTATKAKEILGDVQVISPVNLDANVDLTSLII